MKRLYGLGVTLIAAVILLAGGFISSGTAHADPFNANFEYFVTYSTTAANSNPTIAVQLNIDCPLGTCPATGNTPFFDIAVTQSTANVHACKTADPAPCSGTIPAVGSLLGTSSFQLRTNIVAADLPANVNAITGVPAACGGPGTTVLTSSFPIFNGANSAGDLVSGKDGADADSLPDTQADVRGLAPATAADGLPDGADALPDYIQLLLTSSMALVTSRGYGIAVIVATQAQTDVNFIVLDLTSFGAGYASVTTLGDVRPATVSDLNGSQSTLICTPFTSTTTTTGLSADNPATVPVEVPQPTRGIIGIAGDPIHYAIDVSGLEDVDGDGVTATIDTCPNPDVGLFPAANALTSASGATDSDGDGLGDSCDPVPGSRDNCPAAGAMWPSCAAAGANPASYPTGQKGCDYGPPNATNGTPPVTHGTNLAVAICATVAWDPDQDIDGDSHANWGDNCPTVSNPDQIDNNGDGVGDACQVQVLTATGSRPMRPQHDHDDFCDTSTTIGGTTTPATTCFAATAHDAANGILSGAPIAGVAQDSNDDGFPDFLQTAGFVLTDKGSDSDWDGCTDFSETSGGAIGAPPWTASAAGGCGSSKGVAPAALPATVCGTGIATCENAKRSNTNGAADCISFLPPGTADAAHCNDGGKDDPNGVADWKDLALDMVVSPAVCGTCQEDSSSSPLTSTPDSDGDGCSDRREALAAAPISNGGGRDAMNKWDFFDVDTINGGVLGKNKVISIADVLAILPYIGVNSGAPLTANANGKTYGGDENLDGIKNFETFDRSPAGVLSGPPSGSISIADALSALGQIGANCSSN